MEYCAAEIPAYKPLVVSGYHIREAGSTAAQELAYTLADGFGYVELGLSRGLDVDVFAPGLSFFFDAHLDFFEEIAKFRAARRIWARWMRDVYGAKTAQGAVAALPHPDRRRLADRPAAVQQRRPHRGRGAGGRARRHQLAAHQRAGRDARAAERGVGRDRAAHPAGADGGDRRHQRRRPARRFLVRRGAHRPDRGRGRGDLRPDQGARRGRGRRAPDRPDDLRHPARHRGRLVHRRDRRLRVPVPAALEKGDKQIVGVNCHTGTVTGELEILRVSHEVEIEQCRVLAARRAGPRPDARSTPHAGRRWSRPPDRPAT